MGLDVYCNVVVGVRLLDHAKLESEEVKETRYDERTGEPRIVVVKANILTLWNNRRYELGWTYDKVTQLPGISDLRRWLAEHGLGLFNTNNSSYLTPDDVIGVTDGGTLSMRGGPLSMPLPNVSDAWDKARAGLHSLDGLDIEPSAFIIMEISN